MENETRAQDRIFVNIQTLEKATLINDLILNHRYAVASHDLIITDGNNFLVVDTQIANIIFGIEKGIRRELRSDGL